VLQQLAWEAVMIHLARHPEFIVTRCFQNNAPVGGVFETARNSGVIRVLIYQSSIDENYKIGDLTGPLCISNVPARAGKS
jgi:hypothetical protein